MASGLIRSRNHIWDVYTGTQLLKVKSFGLLSGSNSIGPLIPCSYLTNEEISKFPPTTVLLCPAETSVNMFKEFLALWLDESVTH